MRHPRSLSSVNPPKLRGGTEGTFYRRDGGRGTWAPWVEGSRVVKHDGILDDRQLLGSLLGGGESGVERAQRRLVGGRRLPAALMVVRLPEQQPVEARRRVVLRLPATGAAAAVDATAVRAAAVTAAATERERGAAEHATERAATETVGRSRVVIGIVLVVLVARAPAPRACAHCVPVQPPVHHRVDGRVGVAQQQGDNRQQPVDRRHASPGTAVCVVVVDGSAVRRCVTATPVRVEQRDGVRQPAADEHACQRHQNLGQPFSATGARGRTRLLLLLLLLLQRLLLRRLRLLLRRMRLLLVLRRHVVGHLQTRLSMVKIEPCDITGWLNKPTDMYIKRTI